jgi:hypothetical protein
MRWTEEGFGLVRKVVSFLLLAELLLASGCSTFNHAWTKAAKEPVVTTNTLLGCWEGTWLSDANGHNGNLRCIVTLKDDGTYNARFHAIYKKVLGFGYTVPLKAAATNGVFEFNGEADLGWWAGGVYHYEGHAQDTNFFSTYRCKYDHGVFQMTRPASTNATATTGASKSHFQSPSVNPELAREASLQTFRQAAR